MLHLFSVSVICDVHGLVNAQVLALLCAFRCDIVFFFRWSTNWISPVRQHSTNDQKHASRAACSKEITVRGFDDVLGGMFVEFWFHSANEGQTRETFLLWRCSGARGRIFCKTSPNHCCLWSKARASTCQEAIWCWHGSERTRVKGSG